jgi:hypothetical protein
VKLDNLVNVPLPGAPTIDFQSPLAYQVYASLLVAGLIIFLWKNYRGTALVLLGVLIAWFTVTFIL